MPKNVIFVSVQKAHLVVRTCKEPGCMQRRIGPTVQICWNSGLAIAMEPCLHWWNVYVKRKLRVCSAQKCNPCFGAKSPLRCTDLQRTRFRVARYMADSTNLQEFGASYRQCNVFALMECLYQKEAKGMHSPKMQTLLRCKKPTSQYGLAKNPFSCSAV